MYFSTKSCLHVQIGTLIKSINYALGNLKGWMSTKKVSFFFSIIQLSFEVIKKGKSVEVISSCHIVLLHAIGDLF